LYDVPVFDDLVVFEAPDVDYGLGGFGGGHEVVDDYVGVVGDDALEGEFGVGDRGPGDELEEGVPAGGVAGAVFDEVLVQERAERFEVAVGEFPEGVQGELLDRHTYDDALAAAALSIT
jgi:hypothetical protein